jgi:hypothetical protein
MPYGWISAATTIDAAYDCWLTVSPGTQAALPAIPAGFFGAGSDPIPAGTILMIGNPPLTSPGPVDLCPKIPKTEIVWLDRHGSQVAQGSAHKVQQVEKVVLVTPVVDTIVQRKTGALFGKEGDTQTIPIEILALSLKSASPLVVTFGGASPQNWDVFVTLDGLQTQGTQDLTLTEEAWKMGTTRLGSLPINFKVTFQHLTDTRLITGQNITFSGTQGTFNGMSTPTLSAWGAILLAVFLTVATILILMRRRQRTAEGAV